MVVATDEGSEAAASAVVPASAATALTLLAVKAGDAATKAHERVAVPFTPITLICR